MNEPLHTKMDELLAKYLLKEVTVAEAAEVERWIAKTEANKKQFDHFKLLWAESNKLAAGSAVDENLAWQRFKKKLDSPGVKTVKMPQRVGWMRVAAAVIFILTAAVLLKTLFITNTGSEVLVQTQKNILTDTLPDGSTVTLNKNSGIEYNSKFTKGGKRSVKLKGEAFFTVVPDKKKPFIITVNDIEVKVVGTSFNIKSINGKTIVIVKTGIVEVTKNNATIILMPNDQLATDLNSSELKKETASDKLYNYYQSKEFVCDGTPLWRLVEVLNEAYNAKIVIGRKELRSLPITTTFTNESLDNILQIIAGTFQLDVVKKDNQIILQ